MAWLFGYVAGFGTAWLVGYVMTLIDRQQTERDAQQLLALLKREQAQTPKATVSADFWWSKDGPRAH